MHTHTTAQDRADTAYQALDRLRADYRLLTDASGHIRRTVGLPTPERLEAAGRAHAEQRAESITLLARGLKPLGASPAPAGVDLVRLDTLRTVGAALAELEEAVIERVAPSLAATDTAARRIGTIIKLLPKVAAVDDLMGHVLAETRRLHGSVRYALGEAEEVRTLAARCPYCGARSLRELTGRGMVTCVNIACRCEDDLCSCRDESPGRHQWTADAWRTPTTVTNDMELTA